MTRGQGDLAAAATEAAKAAHHATSARGKAHSFSLTLLRPLPWIGDQVDAVRSLSDVAARLTADGTALVSAAAKTPLADEDHGTGAGVGNLSALSAELAPVEGPLAKTQATVTWAVQAVAKVQRQRLVGQLRHATNQLSDALGSLDKELGVAHAAADLAKRGAQAGPPLRLLFLAQDTWELRPSGGFIGSYGILEIGNGSFRMASYGDATTLPDPVPAMHPPDPLGSNLQHPWTLTGAGWWPDFPTSARAAEQLYEQSGGEHVDGVVGSTQQFIEDLLRAVGTSVTVPGYPDVITPGNVADRILYNVEDKRPQDSPRKKFLTDLTTELFTKLQALHGAQARAGFDAFGKAFTARHLQLYFNDPATNTPFTAAGWTGALTAPAHSDVLALADADFGADKSTQHVHKAITYTVTATAAGRLVADVRIDTIDDGAKTHDNPYYDSYLRVYAPPGATLVDPDHHRTDVRTGTESGLTTFGVGQTIQPMTTGTRHLVYDLPAGVVHDGTYRLLIRPQAGTPNDTITVDLNLGGAPVHETFLAVDGDQTVTARLGAHLAVAPSQTWAVTPPETIAPRCSITAKAPPPLPANPTPAELRSELLARQKELSPSSMRCGPAAASRSRSTTHPPGSRSACDEFAGAGPSNETASSQRQGSRSCGSSSASS